jgi:thioredoxin 1
MTQIITDTNFVDEVTNSKEIVLVDFWAEWCGPCKMLAPIIDKLSEEMTGKIKIVKMNIDENPAIPSQLGIRSIPTMMLFKEGREIASKSGLHQKSVIEEWINSVI